jgi:hypothetical protein
MHSGTVSRPKTVTGSRLGSIRNWVTTEIEEISVWLLWERKWKEIRQKTGCGNRIQFGYAMRRIFAWELTMPTNWIAFIYCLSLSRTNDDINSKYL